jgi:hypothetical protein
MYSWRGYKCEPGEEAGCEAGAAVTVQACSAEDVFGTLNVGFDSPRGLTCEALYSDEVRAFRDRGATAAEFTRLAVEPERGSKELLGAVFHVAYLFAAYVGNATDMFIEVNPRHVGFYKRMLNFSPVGDCKMCERVEAPAVLLHLEVAYMREQVALSGGHRGTDRRSLYPYFCSPEEEAGIIGQIASLGLHGHSVDIRPLRGARPDALGLRRDRRLQSTAA